MAPARLLDCVAESARLRWQAADEPSLASASEFCWSRWRHPRRPADTAGRPEPYEPRAGVSRGAWLMDSRAVFVDEQDHPHHVWLAWFGRVGRLAGSLTSSMEKAESTLWSGAADQPARRHLGNLYSARLQLEDSLCDQVRASAVTRPRSPRWSRGSWHVTDGDRFAPRELAHALDPAGRGAPSQVSCSEASVRPASTSPSPSPLRWWSSTKRADGLASWLALYSQPLRVGAGRPASPIAGNRGPARASSPRRARPFSPASSSITRPSSRLGSTASAATGQLDGHRGAQQR